MVREGGLGSCYVVMATLITSSCLGEHWTWGGRASDSPVGSRSQQLVVTHTHITAVGSHSHITAVGSHKHIAAAGSHTSW